MPNWTVKFRSKAHKAPVLKSRLSQLGAKLVSLSSHSVAIIPLESLEGMLQLCEDALAPLEGLQGRVDAAEAKAQRATAEAEQERSRVRRLESRLAKAAEAVQGLESRLRKWLKAGPQDVEQREEKLPCQSRNLEQSVESCGELMTRLESVKPPVTMPSTSRGEQWEPDSSQCSLCSVHLGKRHLRPRHHCRFCGRCVCGKCSKSSIASDHTVQRCCTRCVQPVVQSHSLWRRLTRVAEALAAPTGATGAPWQGFDQAAYFSIISNYSHLESYCATALRGSLWSSTVADGTNKLRSLNGAQARLQVGLLTFKCFYCLGPLRDTVAVEPRCDV
eukprot:s1949_g9.t1